MDDLYLLGSDDELRAERLQLAADDEDDLQRALDEARAKELIEVGAR